MAAIWIGIARRQVTYSGKTRTSVVSVALDALGRVGRLAQSGTIQKDAKAGSSALDEGFGATPATRMTAFSSEPQGQASRPHFGERAGGRGEITEISQLSDQWRSGGLRCYWWASA